MLKKKPQEPEVEVRISEFVERLKSKLANVESTADQLANAIVAQAQKMAAKIRADASQTREWINQIPPVTEDAVFYSGKNLPENILVKVFSSFLMEEAITYHQNRLNGNNNNEPNRELREWFISRPGKQRPTADSYECDAKMEYIVYDDLFIPVFSPLFWLDLSFAIEQYHTDPELYEIPQFTFSTNAVEPVVTA